jgi:triosephosphate isomerase
MTRRPIAAANWKMHLLRADVKAWGRTVLAGLPPAGAGAEVVVFPSFTLLPAAAGAFADSGLAVGAQDLHPEEKGAHTGDVSPLQLAEVGCCWALCGHSERRRDHGESDELVGRKVAAALRHGLQPLLCVGETRDERHRGETFAVLARQLAAGLESRPATFTLAYEPVWAIGTGETATPEIAGEAHAFLRAELARLGFPAERSRILYGGSVTPENAPSLIAQPDIDGFLVGGASLDPGKFLAIIAACGSAAPTDEDSPK